MWEPTTKVIPELFLEAPGKVWLSATRLDRAELRLGRESGNDIVLGDPTVSRRHALIQANADGTHTLQDLESRNGTFINGQPLRPMRPATLCNGDRIRLGRAAESLLYQNPLAAPPPFLPKPLAIPVILPAILGRDPGLAMTLPSPLVSYRHARLEGAPTGRHRIVDLGSTNGTRVNGLPITQHVLSSGDVVEIGPFRLVYDGRQFVQQRDLGNLRLAARGLRRSVRDGSPLPWNRARKILLDNVSLVIEPREFVALVGGSGAGKSTLMKAMCGVAWANAGDVLVGEDDLVKSYDRYRQRLGYVPQDDILHAGLAVGEALGFAAKLRLPPDVGRDELNQRVDEALAQVGLSKLPRSQLIRSLSGGQRKRVSIAAELLAEPALFFLDEPTSGLDPGLEKQMMALLRRMADSGQTVVLVTHATANIDQCDHVAFMGRGGHLCYFGPPQQALEFFGVTSGDYADIYDALEVDPVAWEQRFRASDDYQEYIVGRLARLGQPLQRAEPQQTKRFGPWAGVRQWATLAMRQLRLIQHAPSSLIVLLAVMPIIGWLGSFVGDAEDLVGRSVLTPGSLSYLPVSAAQRILFVLALASVLLGMFASTFEIVRERPIYERERLINLRLAPYLLAKLAVLGALGIWQAGSLLAVMALKIKLPAAGILLPGWAEIFVTMWLCALAGIALGLLISAIARTDMMAIYILLLLVLLQFLLSGAVFTVPDSLKPLSWLTLTRWGLDGLGSTIDMPGVLGAMQRQILRSSEVTYSLPYEFSVQHLLSRWAVLVGFTAGFTTLAGLTQKLKDPR